MTSTAARLPLTPPSPEAPARADVVVIGAGHNGLVCAAYLARAGRSVVVVEARDHVGGCASSVDVLGARVNTCNCDHTMVLASGIVDDLGLAAHGLRYLEVDPVSIAVGWGDEPVFVQWRSIERTLAGLQRTSPDAAAAYRRYLDAALPVARLLLDVQARPPGLRVAAGAAASRRLRGSATLLRWSRASLLDVLSGFGLPPWIIAAAETTGPAVWGLPPDAPGTGLAAAGFAVRHLVGVGRPVGGSGALPDALAACVRAHGGRIVTGSRVTGLHVTADAVRGVRLGSGADITASVVVCATDPRTLFLDWLGSVPAAAPPRRRLLGRPTPEGYESKLDAVVSSLPVLRALDGLSDDVLPAASRHIPTTIISPSPQQQIAAAAARLDGRITDPPMFFLNTPSVLDPSLRPDAQSHVLSLEVLWTPYAVRGGWRHSPAPLEWLERLASASSDDVLGSVRRWRVMTPRDYERDFSMPRGYAPSYSGSIAATLLGRAPELSRYRTPLGGLFLTGAATFPGAGVWGASGRNTATTVLAGPPRH